MKKYVFKSHKLWLACSSGDLDLVILLAEDPEVDMNWTHPDGSEETPLHRACLFNHMKVVKFLLGHPEVNVNAQALELETPLILACMSKHSEMVALFIRHPKLLINLPKLNGCTAFNEACCYGKWRAVALLLTDPRLDINESTDDQCTPLWFASQEGHLTIVRLILASGRYVNTQTRVQSPREYVDGWHNTTPSEVARLQSQRAQHESETLDEFNNCVQNGPLIADLLDAYNADPTATRQQLRELPDLRNPFIGALFALVIFHCDGLLSFTKKTKKCLSASPPTFPIFAKNPAKDRAARFFYMAQGLPMELQMMLCNRAFGSMKDVVLTQHSEPAFKHLTRSFSPFPSSHLLLSRLRVRIKNQKTK